ncbi:hypothetical protein MRS44_005739 [Fusarium solani]|uniref:uncharacterized protein n=1 Tax=Fusarium solani TaxID=169388 RepID=UPI0032C4068F|nr:hypothetical protein MRS44_005739 [Fusarium solani]
MSWSKLPCELRHDILTRLAEVESRNGKTLTGSATVATEWQPIFEKSIFKNLRIKASELESFQAMFRVQRRRAYLREIGLALELPQQGHLRRNVLGRTSQDRAIGQMVITARQGAGANRHLPGLERQQKENSMAFTHAICALFGQLATWRRYEVYREGIALEIIADSMSYWQKTVTRVQRRTNPVVIYVGDGWEFQPATIPPWMWEKCLDAAKSDFHFSLELDFRDVRLLPRVQAITSLLISRRSVRHFEPEGISEIIRCLPALTVFNWEVRRRAHWKMKHAFDEELSKAMSSWPSSLNDIRIIQLQHLRSHPRPSPHLAELGSGLACRCRHLTRLSINYSIDAFEFFRAMDQESYGLRYLVLRSEQMIIDELPGSNSHLISMAVGAVNQMPKLRFLALYNTSSSHVGYFNYEMTDDMPMLSIRCSWLFEVAEKCLESWQAILKGDGSGSAKWCIERLPIRRVRFLLSVISRRKK